MTSVFTKWNLEQPRRENWENTVFLLIFNVFVDALGLTAFGFISSPAR